MARGIYEGYLAAVLGDRIRAYVLRDAARLALCYAALADSVQKRGLAVIDVAHYGHYGRTYHRALAIVGLALLEHILKGDWGNIFYCDTVIHRYERAGIEIYLVHYPRHYAEHKELFDELCGGLAELFGKIPHGYGLSRQYHFFYSYRLRPAHGLLLLLLLAPAGHFVIVPNDLRSRLLHDRFFGFYPALLITGTAIRALVGIVRAAAGGLGNAGCGLLGCAGALSGSTLLIAALSRSALLIAALTRCALLIAALLRRALLITALLRRALLIAALLRRTLLIAALLRRTLLIAALLRRTLLIAILVLRRPVILDAAGLIALLRALLLLGLVLLSGGFFRCLGLFGLYGLNRLYGLYGLFNFFGRFGLLFLRPGRGLHSRLSGLFRLGLDRGSGLRRRGGLGRLRIIGAGVEGEILLLRKHLTKSLGLFAFELLLPLRLFFFYEPAFRTANRLKGLAHIVVRLFDAVKKLLRLSFQLLHAVHYFVGFSCHQSTPPSVFAFAPSIIWAKPLSVTAATIRSGLPMARPISSIVITGIPARSA